MISSRIIAQSVYELSQNSSKINIADNLIVYLKQNNLLPLLSSIVENLEHIQIGVKSKQELNITSAHKLSEDALKDIKHSLSAEKVGTVTEDIKLIGGFVAEFDGVVYDASIATQLSKLKNTLRKA